MPLSDRIEVLGQSFKSTTWWGNLARKSPFVCKACRLIGLTLIFLLLLLLLAVLVSAQSPTPPAPTATPLSPTATPTVVLTTTPALAVEVRQPPTPPKSFWDKYGVITAIVSGVIGGILALIFKDLLGPIVKDWGQQLREKLKGESKRFRERYIPAVADEHRHLKLVGIHGRERVSPPLLKEVYVSLRMGGADQGLEEARTLSIAQAFTRTDSHLLILGEPGAGKSTLMDWLTLVFTDQISQPTLRRVGDLLPIFLPLRRCVGDDCPLHELMADFDLLPVDLQPPEGFFRDELDQGHCLVLLDGLDEVIDERQRANAAEKINDLVRTYPNNRYVVTCRTAGWKEGLLTGDFARLYIRDFDDADIARFISGWYRAVRTRAVALRGDLGAEGRQRAMRQAEQRAADESARLLEALKRNQSLYRLARNPLILSLIALVHYRRTRLPQGRAKLYQECLEILLEAWDYEDKELRTVGPTLGAKEAILQEIAYYFHSQGLTEAGRDELEALIAPLLPELDCPTEAAETLRQIEERSGILVSRAIGRYIFAHRTLQEYLVARKLASYPEKGAAVLTHLRDESWREVILLYSGLIGDEATALVEAILTQEDDEAHNLLILAGECLAEDVRVAPETREETIGRLEAAFQAATDPLAFARLGETLAALGGEDVVALFGRVLERGDPPRQLAAIRALGELGARAGDPAAVIAQLRPVLEAEATILRQTAALNIADLGQADEETMAALRQARQDEAYEVRAAAFWALLELGEVDEDMIKIPAGEFLMGSPEGKGRENEHPQHTLYLPDYYIARTPVTNAQYASFVADTGHEPPEHWGGYTPPSAIADHPVVYVSWRDCVAYALWLGGVLPSEAEWEKAASWDRRAGRKRRYPWGDEWDPKRCNTEEKGSGWTIRSLFKWFIHLFRTRGMGSVPTTPVGAYSPQGDSPYGCADMAGNVWEWTSSLYRGYPYWADDGREDTSSSSLRVIRGGSFNDSASSARCAFRDSGFPNLRLRDYGFRVGVAAAPFSPLPEA